MNDIHSSILYSAIPIYVHVLVIFLLKIHSILVIRNKRIGSKEKFENLYLYRNFKRTYLFLTYHVDPISLLSLKQHVKITFYKQFSLSFSPLPPPPLTLPPFYLLLFPSPPLLSLPPSLLPSLPFLSFPVPSLSFFFPFFLISFSHLKICNIGIWGNYFSFDYHCKFPWNLVLEFCPIF